MECGQRERHIFMMRVQQYKEVLVAEFTSAFIGLIQPLARKEHPQAVNRRITPLVFAHLIALGIQPQHILYICTLDRTSLKETPASEYQVPLAQIDHALNVCQ